MSNLGFLTNHLFFIQNVVNKILDVASQTNIDYVGHRVVHGGEMFRDVTEMTVDTLRDLIKTEGKESFYEFFHRHRYIFSSELAPLHNPVQISVIKQTMERFKCCQSINQSLT